MYIFGPHDDGEKIIRKLRRRLGDGNYSMNIARCLRVSSQPAAGSCP